jgi:hypothetical protein
MSIGEILEKIKPFYTLLLILAISFILFALGRISVLEDKHIPIKISYSNATSTSNTLMAVSSDSNNGSNVIGSKSGKKYYFPWCSTVKRIKLENQVHFATIEIAKQAGYTPGGNCKGLN